jgi:predicted nucleic acid-binding Zn ribbon protein
LHKYLAAQHVLEASYEALIPSVWPEVVGHWYGRHTRVVRVWEGIVEVQCDSAARAQQLQLDSEEIIRRLNARLASTYVRQIRPSTGPMAGRRRSATDGTSYVPLAPSQAELDALALAPAEELWVANVSAGIQHEPTRRAFQHALQTHLKLRRWKLDHGWQQCTRCGRLYETREGCLECRGS